MKELLFIALVLACPLMMFLGMRGGHGHGGHAHRHGGGGSEDREARTERTSAAELRRRRDELDRLIEEREAEQETPTPIAGPWR
jgi:hypothetical protein